MIAMMPKKISKMSQPEDSILMTLRGFPEFPRGLTHTSVLGVSIDLSERGRSHEPKVSL